MFFKTFDKNIFGPLCLFPTGYKQDSKKHIPASTINPKTQNCPLLGTSCPQQNNQQEQSYRTPVSLSKLPNTDE